MRSLERFLVRLDSGIWGAISRVVLGLAMLPAFRALSGGRDRLWITLALFFGLLIALRVARSCCGVLCHFLTKRRKFGQSAAILPSSMIPTNGRNYSGSVSAFCPM